MLKQALRLTLMALAIVLAAGLVACGGDDGKPASTVRTATGSDEEQIREVAALFEDAVDQEDGELLCSIFSPADVDNAGGGGIDACIRASDTADNPLFLAPESDLSVTEITIDKDGKTARGLLEGGGIPSYIKVDGVWYLDLGATETQSQSQSKPN